MKQQMHITGVQQIQQQQNKSAAASSAVIVHALPDESQRKDVILQQLPEQW